MKSSVSVVIPVYNSELSLPVLLDRLEAVFRAMQRSLEIVFVDDDSADRSWDVITSLAQSRPYVRGIRLQRNCGQHNALLCGVRAAAHEIVVTMDDDLQNPPEEIPRLLEALETRGVDVVYGTPLKESHGFLRDLASRMTKIALSSAMGAETARHVSAFRAFRRSIIRAFADYRSPYVSLDVLMTWGTRRFSAIPVQNHKREIGASNYTVGKLIRHAANMITGFSVLPLQVASIVGFAFTVFGVAVLVYVLARYFIQGDVVTGFPFLASIIVIFAGAQLFALGVIGEYLARIHLRIMDRPCYTVATSTDDAGIATERGAV